MNAHRDTPEDRELVYLALLCQGLLGESQHVEFHDLLASHSWKSQDHRVVFETLAGWRAEPHAIRADLPSRLTRLGYPDTETEGYFAPVGVSVETALGWLRAESVCEPRCEVEPDHGASESRAARSK